MLQSLRNRRSRKGFTLAELLIVVAIIAVLVAIAVPLFMGSINKAEEQVFNADKRALKAAAVNAILSDDNAYIDPAAKVWWVTGTFDGNGDISALDWSVKTKETELDEWKKAGKKGNITIKISAVDLNGPVAPTTSDGDGDGG